MRISACSAGLALCLAVAGCGGGGGGGGDSSQIRNVIGATAELKTKDVCTNDFTSNGVQDFFQNHDSASAAMKDCLTNVGQAHISASDLSYKTITVKGASADATVSLKGRTAKIHLVKQGGWKIDGISAG